MQSALKGNHALLEANHDLVAGNSGTLAGNKKALAANTAMLTGNVAAIQANKSVLEENHGLLGANNAVLKGNASTVSANAKALAGNAEQIGANSEVLGRNATLLAANKATVTANSEALAGNHALLEANKDLLGSNAAKLAANHDMLARNHATLAANAATVTGNAEALESEPCPAGEQQPAAEVQCGDDAQQPRVAACHRRQARRRRLIPPAPAMAPGQPPSLHSGTCPMQSNKATRIDLFSLSTPQMRAFHLSWLAFFVCFFAWFAVAPLMPVIKGEFKLTGDQIANINIAAVGITILVRMLIGPLCDKVRSAPGLHRAADPGRDPGDGHRVCDLLRDLPGVPPGHRRHRRQLRHHAVPHLGDVRAQRGRHRQRHRRRLGQRGRRRDAERDAAAAGRHRLPGRAAEHGLAAGHVRARRDDADRGRPVLALHPGHAGGRHR